MVANKDISTSLPKSNEHTKIRNLKINNMKTILKKLKDFNFRNLAKHLTCLLIGHKVNGTTDSGYVYCKRCYAHSFWDTNEYGSNKWDNAGYLIKPFWWIRWKYNIIKSNLKFNTKNELPF